MLANPREGNATMATIRKRIGEKAGKKTTKWQAMIRRGGHRPFSKTFKTKTEAEAWATAVENSINRDEFVPSPESRRRTVSDMLERYSKTELPKKADSTNEKRYIKFWTDEIGGCKLGAVTRSQIVELRDQMAESKSPATVNRYLATLRHAFRVAMTDWEWCARSPCQKIALKEPRGRDRHLSDKEIAALLKMTEQSEHPYLHTIVLIALTTGARRGEITGLRWSEIDLAKGRAVLHRTKNDDKRSLALVPPVIAELRKLNKVRRIDDDSVFPNPNPKGKRVYGTLEAAWCVARSGAGLGDFRFHDCRHTFASRMAMSGHSLAEIAGALGHRTLAMVQRYSHLTESHVHSAMASTGMKVLGK